MFVWQYYEKLAERVAEVRNEAEEERAKELVKKLHKEQEAALREQWEQCQALQREAVEAARAAVRKQIREELAMEKERAIAEALRIARVSTAYASLHQKPRRRLCKYLQEWKPFV